MMVKEIAPDADGAGRCRTGRRWSGCHDACVLLALLCLSSRGGGVGIATLATLRWVYDFQFALFERTQQLIILMRNCNLKQA